jgi:predicted S18 family serine protease
MDDLLEEIRKLKERVSVLESSLESGIKSTPKCYEQCLTNIDILSVLNSKQELYIQMCDYILEHNVIQVMDKNKIYISHKGKWVGGNDALKELFKFVEDQWIQAYLQFVEDADELTADLFEKYNTIIYDLSWNKHLSKIKQYINGVS